MLSNSVVCILHTAGCCLLWYAKLLDRTEMHTIDVWDPPPDDLNEDTILWCPLNVNSRWNVQCIDPLACVVILLLLI